MGLMTQVAYPGAVLVTIQAKDKLVRVLFGAPPEVSRRLKADQKPGPDGKPVSNFPDVVVYPTRRVVRDTPTVCPEFVLFASAFLGGRYDWAKASMKSPIRWVGTQDELDALALVMKECFLGVDEKELRTQVRSNPRIREMLLNDQKFFSVKDAAGAPHPLGHYCQFLPFDGADTLVLEEGVRISCHRAQDRFTVEYQGERSEVTIAYDGVDRPMWADVYPKPDQPLRPQVFGLMVLGSDSAFSTAGPTTTNLLSLGGEFFLWDCSPFTAWLLNRLGISVGDIRGIFVSHIHDDHVVDLYRFAWNGYRKIEIITTPEVREQVLRKFSALWGVERAKLEDAFRWRVVRPYRPFLINGVSITLHYGAHPIPSYGGRFEYRGQSFGLTGDTSSKGGPVGLDKQLEKGLISQERHDALVDFPRQQFTLCDAGEATIHGFVADFSAYDPAGIMLAHRSDIPAQFADKLKLAGPLFERRLADSNPTVQDAAVVSEVLSHLGSRLEEWVNRLLHAAIPRNAPEGETLVRQGDSRPDFVYLVVAGTAEVVVDGKRVASLERGSFFGEQSFLRGASRNASVVALSPMRVLQVPGSLFLEFIEEDARDARPDAGRGGRESVKDRLERMWTYRHLINGALDGRLNQNAVHALAGAAEPVEAPAGAPVQGPRPGEVLLVVRGSVEVLSSPPVLLQVGDLVGDLAPVSGRARILPSVAREPAMLLRLPANLLDGLLRNTPGLKRHVEDQLARVGRRLRLSRDATA
ncbi:MAG: cyclic nucleotide-binding domain-containing protein [Deltaproteobacteria bacterium]|nr:cyclic nucleotide-binding domain-containing protein [Deltaproteobacteria bacterium]